MPSPCEDAYGKVHGERGEDYGHPLDDFTTSAELLSCLGFRRIDKNGELRELRAEDISVQQRMVKESRRYTSPDHYDSLVDIPGYAETDQMVIEERERRERGEALDEMQNLTQDIGGYQAPAPPPIQVPPDEEVFADPPVPDPKKYDERPSLVDELIAERRREAELE